MENLSFALNATVPLFLMMVLGLVLRKTNIIDDAFASKMNSFVFKIALPVMIFKDLATVDFIEVWDTKFVLFCFFATLISICISAAISMLWKDKSIRGEYIQASYRSSAAILGIAFIQNIYGTSGMAPLMIIGSVPLYNIFAVLVLSFFNPSNTDKKIDSALLKKTAIGVIKNPIIIGIIIGFAWSALKIPLPIFLLKTTTSVGNVASPLGLMAMGASFDLSKAFAKLKPAVCATLTKLLGFCAIFIPIAIMLGFKNEHLIAILVMLGSSTTVASYVMATNMGHEGTMTSSTVMLTTMFSAFTLTFWLFVLRSLGYV